MVRPAKQITLVSSVPEEEKFVVSEDVARMSETVATAIQDGEKEIPLPNVAKVILKKVIDYCEYHAKKETADGKEKSEDDKKNFDADFVKVDQATLFELILAANYMNIKQLLDLCCQTVANMIKGKTPAEIRKTFNIKNDFTPEEEEEVRKENQWAFE